ncbi:uncharacterized protein LOC144166943 [Haemaphysalis longicornis]
MEEGKMETETRLGCPNSKIEKKKESAKKHITKRILSQKRKATLPESEDERDSDDDDELVPKKLLRWAKNRVSELEAKLQLSERRRLEEVRRSRRLEEFLEERTSLCTQLSSLAASVNQALLALKGAATPALHFEPLPEEAPPKSETSHISCSPVQPGPGCATSSDQNQQPTTILMAAQVELSMQPEEVRPATATSHLEAAPATEPLHPDNTEELFVVSNGKASCLVPVAPGLSISSDRWEGLNKSKTDSLFVRDTVRTLWKPEALKDRSVTGKPCMAKLKAGAQGKKELTPEKLGAVRRSGHRYSSLGDALADFCQGPYQVTFVYSDISAMAAGTLLELLHLAGCPVNVALPSSSSGTDPIVSEILTWMRDGQQRYKVLLANISHNFITGLLKPLRFHVRFCSLVQTSVVEKEAPSALFATSDLHPERKALEQRFDGAATWTLYAAGDFTLACTNCGFLHKEEHGYRHLPNISGTHFFISAVNNTPYVVVGKPGPDGEYHQQQGVELDLLKAISGSLNFTYTLLIDPNVEYGALRNGTWTGLVGDVFYRRSHLALSEISYTLNRTDVINYMYPVLYDVLSYVTKAPKVIPFAMAIVKPFNDDVWGCVLCSLVASSLLLLSLRWSPRHRDDDNKPDFWFLLSTLSRQNPWENEHDSAAYRVFLVPWWLLVLVLTTTYSARLVAMMSVAVYEPWLSDLESLERALARRELLLCTHSATIFIEYIKASNVGALNEVRVNQLEGGREDTVLVSDRRTGFERTLYKDFAYMDSR